VLLVRHGESEANATNRFAYRSWDPGLTERGWQQARQLAAQLAHAPITRLVTSPLRRARETLEPLAESLGLPIEVLPALAELDMGRWDGAVLSELAQQEPQAWQAWRRDPDANPPPRGERLSGVGRRVLQGLDQLRDTTGLVVAGTHADCVKGALTHLLGVSGPLSRRLVVPNTGQLLLRAMDDGTWRIVLSPLVLSFPSDRGKGG
jgi:broad specificity phosphatase PhoE